MLEKSSIPGDVHVVSSLTNFSQKITQERSAFIARSVVPTVPVVKSTDRYVVHSAATLNRDEAADIAAGAEAPTALMKFSNELYEATKHGVRTPITDEAVADADEVLQLEQEGTEMVTDMTLRRTERKVMGTLLAANVWSGNTDQTPSVRWNQANSDPLGDIQGNAASIQAKTGIRPNRLLLGQSAWNALVANDSLLGLVSGGATSDNPAQLNRRNLAALFELEEIHVASAIYNSADENQTASTQFIAGDVGLLYYAPRTAGRGTATAAAIFNWTGLFGQNESGVRVRRYRDEPKSTDFIEAQTAFDIKVTGSDLGVYFTDLVN